MSKMKTPVEVDITYVNKHWYSNRPQNNVKHYVLGIFQRQGEAGIVVLADNKPETIHAVISTRIVPGCTLYTEEKILPASLAGTYDIQELTESDGHARGDIHVNNVKNMWRDLKRLIKTTHISVSQKHLQGYCDEVAWRTNRRDCSPMEKFNELIKLAATTNPIKYKTLAKHK